MKNRARASERTKSAGAAITSLVEQVWSGTVEPAGEAANALAELVDEEFGEHCRVARWESGMLRIHVDDPSLVSLMRLRWANRLREAWSTTGCRRRLKKVVFIHGVAGTPISV